MLKHSPDVAFFLRFLGGGGAERIILNLAHGFVNQGLKVDLVLSTVGGPHLWQVPSKVRIVDLQAPSLTRSLPSLMKYLQREEPKAMLSTLHYTNEFAVWAKQLSRVPTRVVVREANSLSSKVQFSSFRKRLTPFFIRHFYPWADGIVAISKGVAKDLNNITGLSSEKIKVIYNPAITPDLINKAREPVDHPWFASDQPPVILGVGKLQPQKDFPTLIRAFAKVRQVRQARLVILGWGPDRTQLEALAKNLGVENEISFPGHVKNPYAYMARSAVFVLSSAWEGFGNVLVEAMAAGVPVVSTDCKSGPAEILDNGKYGFLTPVEDDKAIAEAILSVLSGNGKQVDSAWLDRFSLTNLTQEYLKVLGIVKN